MTTMVQKLSLKEVYYNNNDDREQHSTKKSLMHDVASILAKKGFDVWNFMPYSNDEPIEPEDWQSLVNTTLKYANKDISSFGIDDKYELLNLLGNYAVRDEKY